MNNLTNLTIENSIIASNEASGIRILSNYINTGRVFDSLDDVVIRGNTIADNDIGGILIYVEDDLGLPNLVDILIENNTLLRNKVYGGSNLLENAQLKIISGSYGWDCTEDFVMNLTVRNNTVLETNGYAGIKIDFVEDGNVFVENNRVENVLE